MLIKIHNASDCKESEVTDEHIYHSRRSFISHSAPALAASTLAPGLLLSACDAKTASDT
ncbi:MAG: mononuclear molybdenum enzyme YedY, partial [Pseudomonadales bacterium]|nr:mononuclear molybdenum enzyme YedY [Pseudomonadales bacterium]